MVVVGFYFDYNYDNFCVMNSKMLFAVVLMGVVLTGISSIISIMAAYETIKPRIQNDEEDRKNDEDD